MAVDPIQENQYAILGQAIGMQSISCDQMPVRSQIAIAKKASK